MRSVALSGLFIVSAFAMNAQKLSLTPQVGFENSRTSVNYNGLGSFAPLGGGFDPQVSLRLDYKFKQGFGPYIGASTSRSAVLYGFNDIVSLLRRDFASFKDIKPQTKRYSYESYL